MYLSPLAVIILLSFSLIYMFNRKKKREVEVVAEAEVPFESKIIFATDTSVVATIENPIFSHWSHGNLKSASTDCSDIQEFFVNRIGSVDNIENPIYNCDGTIKRFESMDGGDDAYLFSGQNSNRSSISQSDLVDNPLNSDARRFHYFHSTTQQQIQFEDIADEIFQSLAPLSGYSSGRPSMNLETNFKCDSSEFSTEENPLIKNVNSSREKKKKDAKRNNNKDLVFGDDNKENLGDLETRTVSYDEVDGGLSKQYAGVVVSSSNHTFSSTSTDIYKYESNGMQFIPTEGDQTGGLILSQKSNTVNETQLIQQAASVTTADENHTLSNVAETDIVRVVSNPMRSSLKKKSTVSPLPAMLRVNSIDSTTSEPFQIFGGESVDFGEYSEVIVGHKSRSLDVGELFDVYR